MTTRSSRPRFLSQSVPQDLIDVTPAEVGEMMHEESQSVPQDLIDVTYP